MRRALGSSVRVLGSLCARTAPSALAAARLVEGGAAVSGPAPASAAAVLQACRWGRWSSSESGGGSGGGGSPGGADAWEAVSKLSSEAQDLAEEGNAAGAKELLKTELPRLAEKFGAEDPAVGLIYNQLALWSFYEGEYQEAVDNAAAAHKVWVSAQGEESSAACFHGIRLGMTLAAAGRVAEAFPLLEKGLTVAISNYNHHVKELQTLQPLAEGEESTDASARATEKDEAAMAARAEQTRMSVAMLEKLGRALEEAKFYRALSFLGTVGREMEDNWEEKGQGAVFYLQQEMSDSISDMLRWVMPDHPTVQCCLREHTRLVAQCEKEGLRRLADDMQIHNQRLQDVVHEARTGQDG